MTATQGIDWRQLGTPDYAQVSALISSLPEAVRSTLKAGEREILVRIVHICWRKGVSGGRGRGYAYPTEGWLAKVVDRSERTVRRYLEVLKQCGLLKWRNRMRPDGTNTSNLYFIGKTFERMIRQYNWRKSSIKPVRTKMSDDNSQQSYNAGATPATGVYKPPAWMDERKQSPHLTSRHVVSFAPRVEESGEGLAERKAWLKKQAEQLKARGY